MKIVLNSLAALVITTGFAVANSAAVQVPPPAATPEVFSPEAPVSAEAQPAQIEPVQVDSATLAPLVPAGSEVSAPLPAPQTDPVPAPADAAQILPVTPQPAQEVAPASTRSVQPLQPAPTANETVGHTYTFSLD